MTHTSVHPDEVVEALLAKGNRRDKNEKLSKLHELCFLEFSRHSQGARDLSLSNMSKIAESHGLFKARTIYNAQSADYAALIKAWEAYNGPKVIKSTKKQIMLSDKHAFLLKIEDPAVRILCQMAFIERDKVRAELNMLKAKVEVIVDMRPLRSEFSRGSNNVTVVEPFVLLTDSERNALTAAIDSKTLAHRHWRLGETGEVIDERDRFVFMPGFATGIAKILGNKNSSPSETMRKKF